jgi:phosphoglycerate dehydrogenase-like enzyme/predicted dehydrogenase
VALHMPVLARLRDRRAISLALVCDVVPERAATAQTQFGFGGRTGDARTALARPDVDIVYVFGSAQLHYEYGLIALRNRKHLFVEKPIAPTYGQALELERAAMAGGLVAVGGHNRRFYKALAAVRERSGAAGWGFVEAVFHKPDFGVPPPFGARTWLTANGIHALDAMLFMMGGLPEWVAATSSCGTAPQPTSFSALLRWGQGRQGVFLCNNAAGARREEYVFHAPGETCTVTDEALTVVSSNGITRTPIASIGDGIVAEHESFLAAIRSGATPPHSIGVLAPSLRLAELIEAGYTGLIEEAAELRPLPLRPPAAPDGSIVVTNAATFQAQLASLSPRYTLVSIEDIRDSSDPRTDVVAAILGRGSPPLSREVLDKLPRLAVVGVAGLSVAQYDPDTLLARGIALINASEAYAETVGEFAFALAVLARRRGFTGHESMRRGGWSTQLPLGRAETLVKGIARSLRPLARAAGIEAAMLRYWKARSPAMGIPSQTGLGPRDLSGASVGLIGWGANARSFATRLMRAKARVLVYSEYGSPDDIVAHGAVPASLGDVLAAEIVSLHRGLNDRTRHSLGSAELARLRRGAVLINVARGGLIDPTALIRRLRRGDIFACLDTFDEEPLAPTHPLRKLPNVFLTPHIAGGNPEMVAAAGFEVVRKVDAYLSRKRVETLSTERLRTMT